MKWMFGMLLGLAVVSIGAAAAPQTPAAADAHQMPQMQQMQMHMEQMQTQMEHMQQMQQMMAQLSAADDQLAALRTELNEAKTVDAKLAATTKILNALLDQRAAMRMNMQKGMPAAAKPKP